MGARTLLAAPLWCIQLDTETACASHFALDLRNVPQPCTWLDNGCRAANATMCTQATSSSPQGGGAYLVVLLFIALTLLSSGSYLRRFGYSNLLRQGRQSKLQQQAKRGSDEECVVLTGDNVPEDAAESSVPSGLVMPQLAEVTIMCAEAATEAAAACAAAHALLNASDALLNQTEEEDSAALTAKSASVAQSIDTENDATMPTSSADGALASHHSTDSDGEELLLLEPPPQSTENDNGDDSVARASAPCREAAGAVSTAVDRDGCDEPEEEWDGRPTIFQSTPHTLALTLD